MRTTTAAELEKAIDRFDATEAEALGLVADIDGGDNRRTEALILMLGQLGREVIRLRFATATDTGDLWEANR